ncbi:hypothetical protein DAETH_19930 [Deinococcus aetherius]|uniref:DUF1795 domain-containing protein n=1 Tax=Deinococcus aetherius TaxID=200252 RepID=A0ABM8AE77_9DEIO|nr:hypothetical protein [Deinococcus aetherius]BDP42024.1 hypothetical protein DAETH_19930 [Deinococcus aetherius]
MKKVLLSLLAAGLLSSALAAPVKLQTVPVTLEPNARLLTLSEAGITKAFPVAASRPDAVFLTEDRKVTVAFEWREGRLAPAQVADLVTQFPAVIRAQVPNVKTLRASLVQMGGAPWAQFVFTTPGQGDDVRREFLITSLQGRTLVVTIAAKTGDYSRNETVIRNLVNSVRVS